MNDKPTEIEIRMELPYRVGMVNRFIKETNANITFTTSSHLIDLGCGTGLVGLRFAPKVSEITMIDTSVDMIDILRRKIERDGVNNATILQGELNDYQGEAIDGILSLLVLHHIEDTAKLFKQAYNRLKTGGYLIIGDAVTEDGSFHEPMIVPHNGFDMNDLSGIATGQGFSEVEAYRYDTYHKNNKDYPLFILIAKK